MITFPNCKINLGLRILRQREDYYHDLETVFYPIPLTDILEIVPMDQLINTPTLPFTYTGLAIDGDLSSNLCAEAFHLMVRDFKSKMKSVKLHLHKVIPYGAGLGGGSSNATFLIKMLNKQFELGLTQQEILEFSWELGSDCPFFAINKPCIGTGRGEQLEEIELDLSDYKIVIVNPAIKINTGMVFKWVKPALPERSVKDIIKQPVTLWKDHLLNDFEKIVFKDYEDLPIIKDTLYQAGATYASMSGSGSTMYGLFPKEMKTSFNFPDHYFIREYNLPATFN